MKNIEIGTEVTDIGGDIYVIKEQIGAGGFAIVYRAERSDDKLDYAIKVATGNDKSVLGSMKNEYEAASKIHSLHSIEYLHFNLRKMEIEERIYKPLLNVEKIIMIR